MHPSRVASALVHVVTFTSMQNHSPPLPLPDAKAATSLANRPGQPRRVHAHVSVEDGPAKPVASRPARSQRLAFQPRGPTCVAVPTAALRTSREAARGALREPGPFALALPLVGNPTRLARSLLRATGGLLQAGAIVAADGVWTLRATPTAPAVLLTPLLAGAAGLGRLQHVVRVLRADGAALTEAPVSVFMDAPLHPRKLGHLQTLCARQLPLVQPVPTVPSLPSPHRVDASRKRLERIAVGPRWLGFARQAPLDPVAGLDLRPLLAHGLVAIGLEAQALHSGEITALVQVATGLLHRAHVARAVARTPRPTSAESARYDLRVALLYLGFIGAEFRAQREQLLQRVTGSAAWKHGAPRKLA